MTNAVTMDLRFPALAPRTRLYPLEPIGGGSPEIESLTSYVMRLAEAHSVATSALVTAELLPLLEPQGRRSGPAATWLLEEGPRFNGMGEAAREVVEALAALTGRQDLVFLTLRPWAPVLAPYGLIRLKKQARVWCSACYADALAHGRPLYEPLLWSIAVVTVCPRHRVRLSAHCPYHDCARALPLIAALARPGHCSWCKRVLCRRAGGSHRASEGLAETGWDWDLWVAQQVGTLLALAPSWTAVVVQTGGVSALDAFIQAQCGSGPGAYAIFARTVGIHANVLCRWRKGHARPTLDLLLRVCHFLGVSLAEFLMSATSSLPGDARPTITMTVRRKPRQPPTAHDAERLRREVEALLPDSASPPPSVAETARQLGCPSAVLSRLCPDACRIIADRYKAFRAQQREERTQHLADDIRQVMAQFDAAGLFPASKRVRARLQCRVHPRNSDYNRIRRQLLREFGWNSGGTRIRSDQAEQLEANVQANFAARVFAG